MHNRLLAGRYRLLEPLGRGGMGQVYRARDESLARLVAIKTLELDGADPSAAERFRREARTTARLTHRNIVTVFDTGTDDTTAFLVMELLPGPSLQDRLAREGPLPVSETARVGAQMAAALAAAHAAGVVHRDVKPSNAAYAADGQVKVLDFGIARLTETATAAARLTQTAMVIGTAAYLSPEQASGGPVGPYSDLYALGCVLFTLLAGSPPFTGDTPVAISAQHLHAQPPDLAALCPECPPDLTGLIGELLIKDPAARPRDAAAVAGRLAALAGPEADAIMAAPSPAPPTTPEMPPAPPVPPTAPGMAPVPAAEPGMAPVPPTAPGMAPPATVPMGATAAPGDAGGTRQLPSRDWPPRGSRPRSRHWVTAACIAAAAVVAAVVAAVTLTGGPRPGAPGTGTHAPATGASRAPAVPSAPTARPATGPVQRPGDHRPGPAHGHGGPKGPGKH